MKKDKDIIFWSDVLGIPEIEPVDLTQNFKPGWYNRAPNLMENQIPKVTSGTIKTCPAIMDFFKLGYVVPLWCDLYVNVQEDGSWTWRSSDDLHQFDTHDTWQFKDHLPTLEARDNVALVMKAMCPWHVKTPKGVSMLQLPMHYHYDSRFSLMPGIIPTDIFHNINQQLVIHKTGDTLIPRGTPLGMYIPIKNEKYNLIVREATEGDQERQTLFMNLLGTKLTGRMRSLQKFWDKRETNKRK